MKLRSNKYKKLQRRFEDEEKIHDDEDVELMGMLERSETSLDVPSSDLTEDERAKQKKVRLSARTCAIFLAFSLCTLILILGFYNNSQRHKQPKPIDLTDPNLADSGHDRRDILDLESRKRWRRQKQQHWFQQTGSPPMQLRVAPADDSAKSELALVPHDARQRYSEAGLLVFTGVRRSNVQRNRIERRGHVTEVYVRADGSLHLWLHNDLPNENTTLHLHGMRLTSAQDGVPFISALPVLPRGSAQINVPLDYLHAGTYWMHSHYHFQHPRGAVGVVNVMGPVPPDHFLADPINKDWIPDETTANEDQFENGGQLVYDVTVLLEDVCPRNAHHHGHMPGDGHLLEDHCDHDDVLESMLEMHQIMNMTGPIECDELNEHPDRMHVKYDGVLANGRSYENPQVIRLPSHQPFVRLRFVNAAGMSAFRIDLSPLKKLDIRFDIVSSDSALLRPPVDHLPADHLLWVAAGQRLDVLVDLTGDDYECNDDAFWHIKAVAEAHPEDESQVASFVLVAGEQSHVSDQEIFEHLGIKGDESEGVIPSVGFMQFDTERRLSSHFSLEQMSPLYASSDRLWQLFASTRTEGQLTTPPAHLLARHEQLRTNRTAGVTRPPDRVVEYTLGYASHDGLRTVNDVAYRMSHTSYLPHPAPTRVKLGEKVRMRIVNLSSDSHAMHLHGHLMKVVAIEQHGKPREEIDGAIRDTVLVPGGCHAIEVDVIFDNPGTWLFHCHMVFHAAAGMTTVIEYTGDIAIDLPSD